MIISRDDLMLSDDMRYVLGMAIDATGTDGQSTAELIVEWCDERISMHSLSPARHEAAVDLRSAIMTAALRSLQVRR